MGNQFESLRGQLLLDGGKLRGSFFHRSVVLICQHDAEGAFGLVINQTAENNVGEMVLEDLPESIQETPLYIGGPVQPGALSFLHSDVFLPTANVIPNINLGHSIDELGDLGSSFSPTQRIRIYAGYAGWSPGQLEAEIEADSWLIHPATQELVFESPSASLWRDIMKLKTWKHKVLADSPEDPSWN